MTTRIEELTEFCKIIEKDYELAKINIDGYKPEGYAVEFGEIYSLTINLDGDIPEPLIIVPAFSLRSYTSLLNIILQNKDVLKYKKIYMFCWNDVVKTLHTVAPDFPAKNKIREKLAVCLNRIFDMHFSMPCHLLGKSAGGGVAMHLTNMRDNIKKLFICCPANPLDEDPDAPVITKKIPVKLMWNKDDVKATGIDYIDYLKFLRNFDLNKINFSFYSYNEGGHEIHPEFIKELF